MLYNCYDESGRAGTDKLGPTGVIRKASFGFFYLCSVMPVITGTLAMLVLANELGNFIKHSQ